MFTTSEIIVSILSVSKAVDIFNVLVGVPELEEICFDRKVLKLMGTMDLQELISLKDRSTTEAQHRWYNDPRVLKRLRIKSFTDLLEVYTRASSLDRHFFRGKSFLQSLNGLIVLRKSAKLGDGAYLDAFGALINRITEPMTLVFIDCTFIDQMLSLMSNTDHVVYMAVLFSMEELSSNLSRYSKENGRYVRCNRKRMRLTTEMPRLKLLYRIIPRSFGARYELKEDIYFEDEDCQSVLGAFKSVMCRSFEVKPVEFPSYSNRIISIGKIKRLTLFLTNWGIFHGITVPNNRDYSRMKYGRHVGRNCNPKDLLIQFD